MLPMWLIAGEWREECKRDPVASYISGQYFPCHGSPLNKDNVNKRINGRDYCPLEWAASYGNVDVTKELIEKGARQDLCGSTDDKLLRYSFGRHCDLSNSTKELLEIYKRSGIRLSRPDELLLISARNGCSIGVGFSISAGASVAAKDGYRRAALDYTVSSASEANIESTMMLVSAGADINAPSNDGETPYQKARRLLSGAKNWEKMEAALLNKKAP